MNPRIKQGWDYFWNLKPSQVGKMKNEKLIAQFHVWQSLIMDERKGDVDWYEVMDNIFKSGEATPKE